MKLSDSYSRIPLTSIRVLRDERQRREVVDSRGQFINSDGLLDSISEYGVLSPVLLTRDHELVYGERRYEASKALGLPDIPFRYLDEATALELQVLEFEENSRRSTLSWREEVCAVAKLHELMKGETASWSISDTAQAISYSQLAIALRVHRDLDNPLINSASSVRQAYNLLSAQDERRASQVLDDMRDTTTAVFGRVFEPAPAAPQPAAQNTDSPPATPSAPQDLPILCADFNEWAPQYSGPKFNFLHCDFPYGTQALAGTQQAGQRDRKQYSNTDEDYTALVRTLCTNLPRLCGTSFHIMFWLSTSVRVQWETIRMFNEWAPQLDICPVPGTWLKSDNAGFLPAAKRIEPRRITESFLLLNCGDRPLVKLVSNGRAAPTDTKLHPSTKPVPVLSYFFQMFVDDTTRMLDPTCGSGASLRAAEALGARHVLGLEVDPEFCATARSALQADRNLRKLSEKK